jgi:hypothetical protein
LLGIQLPPATIVFAIDGRRSQPVQFLYLGKESIARSDELNGSVN